MKRKRKRINNKEVSEQELLDTIEIISKKLAYKFKFGYHEIEDMRQQISIFAIEGMENYDHKRPLENFLWTHVRNRLFNFKRDNYQRPNKPCTGCPFQDAQCADSSSDCTKYYEKLDCELYARWFNRNNTKKNLMYLNTIEEITEYSQKISKGSVCEETREIVAILDEQLTGEHRKIYLKIKQGSKVLKNQARMLKQKIKEIIS